MVLQYGTPIGYFAVMAHFPWLEQYHNFFNMTENEKDTKNPRKGLKIYYNYSCSIILVGNNT